MSIEQQRKDAISDFEALIIEDTEIEAALAEAADSNGLRPDVLRTILSRDIDIESRADMIRREAHRAKFLAAAQAEVERYKQDPTAYSSEYFNSESQILELKQRLEATLERLLTEHEVWTIWDMHSPFMAEFKMMGSRDKKMRDILWQRALNSND